MTRCGIYRITCLPSGRAYIGSSIHPRIRWGQHRSALRAGRHHSFLLQRAWDKHGEAAFVFDMLLYCDVANKAHYEQALIDFYQTTDHAQGMNIATCAHGGNGPMTDELRAKHSAIRIGKPIFKNNPVTHARMMAAVRRGEQHNFYGRKHSEESLRKMSAALKGRVAPNKGLQSPFRGVKRDPEIGRKISATKQARKREAVANV